MNILIEVPTWLGDSVMITPAVENIVGLHPNAKLTIFGSAVSVAIFKHHPNVEKVIIDNSRTANNRLIKLKQLAKNAGYFDAAFSFRRQFSSRFFIFFARAKHKANYRRYSQSSRHQVLRYNDFISKTFHFDSQANALKIYQPYQPTGQTKKILGINPGASYGSAKRWYPDEFAKVASALSGKYDIVIFGSEKEKDIAHDIEKKLIENQVDNYQNLAGKTTIDELIQNISQLDLLITGDSGPMHLAAAFQVPTVAIFGPTKDDETSQWMNKQSVILKKNFDCQPCMKRICPLKGEHHHRCMKSIDAQQVLTAINNL